MKIELPTSIINQLLIESETFRCYVIDNYVGQVPVDGIEYYRHLVRTQFPDWYKNKIPPIKWIREFTRNKHDILDVFAKHGYESYKPFPDSSTSLTLAGAKRFVDSIIN